MDTMALGDTGQAPYAPARAVLLVIDRYRDKGLTVPVTVVTLNRLGIEESLARRTLASLKQLDLLDESAAPTPTFDTIKKASTADLQSILEQWVRAAYAPIFSFVEPTDEVQRIIDQFRHYEPAGMRNRMVTLFLGLCAAAGIIPEVPPIPRVGATAAGTVSNATAKRQGRRKLPNQRTPPPDPKGITPPTSKLPVADTDVRQRYVDLLLAKAAEQDTPDPELLDRIERALGISPTAQGSA